MRVTCYFYLILIYLIIWWGNQIMEHAVYFYNFSSRILSEFVLPFIDVEL